MKTFAVIEATSIVNVILAESLETAESITGKTCIEYTNEPAEIGGTYENGVFKQKKPFPSWVYRSGKWEPPVSEPNDGKPYAWDEESLSWITFVG
jgi:hypothetical protein